MAENPFIDLIDQKVAAEQSTGGTSPANPFVPLIDENEQSKSVAFRAAMTEAKDTEPDAYAKQVELAKRTGIPVETVARNTDKVNREAPFLSGEYEELIQTSPNTVRFLSEEDNAKYAKDDIPQLTVMEEIAKMSNPKSLVKDLGRSFMSGVSSMNAGIAQTPALIYNAGAAAYNVAAIPQNFVADKLNIPGLKAQEQGTAPDWLLNNPVATYYKKAAEYYAPEELSQDPIQLMREGNGKQAARAIAAQVVANLPQQAFLVASTLAGQPQVALGAMGVLSASQATAEAQENGKSAIQATLDALAQGSIEVATEQFGTVGIVKHWETALAKSFGKGTAKQIIADAGRSIAASFFGEGTEEFAAQIGQDFSDYATGNDRALDGTLQRAMNAFLIGGFSGATVSSPAVLTAATIKSQRANQDGAFWDRMLGVSAESKLRQRSPAKYEAFVDNLLKDKAANTGTDVDGRFFYVSHDALKTFFQTPEGKPDEAALNKFLEEMEVRDQLADAAAVGKEFELSAAKFAAKFAGSDLSQAIRADIRFSPDGMTQREQANLQAEYQKMVTEMQQSYSELVDTQKLPPQVEVMRDKLILPKDKGGMGIAAEDADAQISVFMAGMNTFARKSGIPVEEYVRRVNPVLNIGGEAVNLAPAVQKPFDPNSVKKAKPIDYSDPVNVQYRDLIAASGGEFIGTQPGFKKASTGETVEGLVMFNDPVTGTTLALKPSELTPEKIAAKVQTAQAASKAKGDTFFQVDQAQIQTPEFQDFFNGSKVVDESGNPLVVYHGTQGNFEEFKRMPTFSELSDIGFHFGPSAQANSVLRRRAKEDTGIEGFNVKPVFLSIKNPLRMPDVGRWELQDYVIEGIEKQAKDNPFYTKEELDALKAKIKKLNKGLVSSNESMQAIRDFLIGKGYDGIVYKNKYEAKHLKADSFIAFDPTQIKSATGNNGEFDPDNPNILFQDEAGDDLVAMHNLSAENVLHADKIGGLAVPSLSIAKQKHPLTGFGEISLVASKDMIDPKRGTNKVFNADVYSPRYPTVHYDLDQKALGERQKEGVFKQAGDALGTTLRGDLDGSSFQYRGVSEFLRLPVVQLAYLQSIGVEFEVPKKKAQTPTLNLNPKLKKLIDRYSAFGTEEAKKPGFLDEYEKARLKEKEKFIKGTVKDGSTLEEAEKTYTDLFKGVWYDEEDGSPTNNVIRTMANEVRQLEEKGKPDYYAAQSQLNGIISKQHKEAFDEWAQNIFTSLVKSERLRVGETPSGYDRYLPHNLENVVKVMKRTLADGEGFNYGVGSIRATVAKQFRTITEIQKDRSNIIPEADMEKLKEEVNQELFELMDKFTPYLKHFDKNRFGNADMFSEHLKEMTTRGTKAVVDDYYNGYVPAEVLEEARTYLDKLRNMPTEYFEAKIQRAVAISEFAAALVPDNVSEKVIQVLKKNGIQNIVKYDRDKGNSDKRNEALKELKGQRPDLFFQQNGSPQGSVQFTDTATLINLYKSANFSTFLHESGHIFMREMQKLVEAGVADEQLSKDFSSLVQFVGGDIKTVEAQEKLARAFEAYLREGKAPSVKLVNAFQRFRDWLTAIYKAIAGLNVEITDEVRQVFDRLLASQNEVDEAQQFYRAKKSLMDLMPVTPEQRAKVTAAKNESDEAALAKAVKERLGVYLRVQGGKAAIREQATKDIDALPVYKAIKSGIDQNGIDAEIFKANYGEAALKLVRLNHPNFARTKAKAKKGRTYYAEVLARGGISPDSMGEIERKYFKEHGLFGLFRKDGRGLDDLAASLMDEGLLQVPDDKNPDDHLKALLEGKKSIPDSEPFVPEDAVTLGELAVENDFRSEQDLAQSVIKADRRSRAITKRAKELLAAKEADLLKDLKSEERVPGEEAIHNDKSLTFLITEAELLADKIADATRRRPERIEEKLYKNAAEEIISKKTVRQATRYDLYARAEQRFARQSEDALLNGDYTNALILKKKQLLNHAMVQAAIRARDEKLKIEKFFQSKNYKGKLANVENDFAQASLDLTSTYKLGTGDLVPTAPNALERIRTADEFLFSAIPEWIVNKQIPKNFQDYRDLSMAQLRELNDAIRSILQYGNDEMKSIEEGEAKTLQEWVDESVAEMQKLKDRDTKRRDESSKLSKPLELIDAFASGASLLQFTSDWMDNFSFMKTGNAGPFKRLYNKVLQAEVKYTDLKTEVVKDSKKAWDTLGKSATRIAKIHGSHFEIPGVPLTEDMRRTKRSMWTVNRMIALLLNTGNAGNLSALQRSYGYTDQQLKTVASYFTAAELEAIQDIWNATDLLFPQLDETHFSIYNRHLPKVDALPVTYQSTDGKQVALKGGYYPLVFDHKINDVAAANMEEDLMKNQTAAVIRSTKPTDGFTFSRVSGHSLPPVLETYVWFNHINATARYISHARILRDLNRFTRDKTWAKEFKKKAGDDHYKNIRGWLQYNANPSRRLLVSKLDLMADWLKSLSTAAVLGFKTATGLKQRTALINAAQAIGKDKIADGWTWILKAYREVDLRTSGFGLSQSETWDSILKKSPYLKTREGNIDRELSDLRRGIDPLQKKWKIAGKEFTVRDLQDFAFEWIKMNDRATVAIVWTASYNQYVQEKAVKGATPESVQKAAAAYADGIVQDTQASSLTPELSTLQRQEGWLRLFTSFMTSSINYGNRIMQNHRAWKAGAISNKEFFNHVLHENIAMPYAAFLITQCLRGGSDEPPEWWEWLMVPFEAAASFIPIIRDVFAYFQYGKEIGETPVLEPVARTAKALKTTGKFIVGDADFTQAAWDIGRAIEVYLKVPALNIVKDITGAYENLTE